MFQVPGSNNIFVENNIRNVTIVAHVDHGKSTLADRLLEITGTVPKEKLKPQLLDSLSLERERGITIKLAPVRMTYVLGSKFYVLNLIDTPGHVDFSYEVSRSLAAVEGAILLIDATQGIQAQTLSHAKAALEQNLVLIPVINKIDLEGANIESTALAIQETFGFRKEEIILASAKTGEGVDKLLEAIIKEIPPPKVDPSLTNAHSGLHSLRALVFDSFFDPYKGIVAFLRIREGQTPKLGSKIHFLGAGIEGEVLEVGYFRPELTPTKSLSSGEIGYLATGVKQPDLVRVGDTISTTPSALPLGGYQKVKPMVYTGLYPIEPREYSKLKEILSKFRLNDPAFSFEPENSQALGAGFRCGFLGLLHAEVVQERLREEFGIDLIATSPSVEYLADGQPINNPSELGPNIKSLKEPWVSLKIFTPVAYLGPIINTVGTKRVEFVNQENFSGQITLSLRMPMAEMITGFYSEIKSISSGYASLDWEFLEYRQADAVKLSILVGGKKVDALETIVYRPNAQALGRKIVARLKGILPRQNFEIALQAAIEGKIIARVTIPAYRKDVTAKLYGGDRTRKDKLLEKQRLGKKKMKMIGQVAIPQEAFLTLLKSEI